MADWLRYIAMIFYAPMRGMREVRDRGTLLPAIICAYVSQIIYLFVIQWLAGISIHRSTPGNRIQISFKPRLHFCRPRWCWSLCWR